MQRGARRPRARDAPVPTPCYPAQCFDPLLRLCVACELFRTPEARPASPPSAWPRARVSLPAASRPLSQSPPPAAGSSSVGPGTALQPQESVGAGGPEAALSLSGLLLGAPALLGLALALALALVGLVSWRYRRLRGAASPEAPDGGQNGTIDATAPVWPPPMEEDPGTTPPGHSVPVPATELGSTELVTTKTAGLEQQ
ncbi:tumor necrosis factor receptor superfamily member 13C isoform X2 [Nycticebus coucang]|uniref:tumor necrosis factor receptor superfamily member 13C isoform X2 n=1 Tax=Nycticebus coucang TaxID=9470 RepID=UPI00234CAAB2|nr:tumor necrosis factor receptor superfamily member 13C isoform X2 [Nycticebus coucang]